MRRESVSPLKWAIPSICALLAWCQPVWPQSVVISEFLASNHSTNFDHDGDSSDWIELHNVSGAALDLGGHTMTDDAGAPDKWRLPSFVMPDGGYLLVWASGKDLTGQELHASFKLSAVGEFIGIFASDGSVVDTVTFGRQVEDVSLARIPDAFGAFVATANPTPAEPNDVDVPGGAAVTFSPKSGFFEDSLQLRLSSPVDNVTIRYTTDGSTVNAGSARYGDELLISSTTVVRVRVFDGGAPVGDDISHIYLIDYDGTLPVLSYATDNRNLFGSRGIFDNPGGSGKEWERAVSVNLVERDGSGIQINAGMRAHGGRSRRQDFPKVSTRLYFRSEYGPSKLRYRLFETKKIDEFDRLVVHSGGSSDQFFRKEGVTSRYWSLIRDPLNHRMWGEHDGVVSAARPVVLFINGDPWGIYHIRERVDEHYLESNYGIEDADLLRPNDEKIVVEAGDKEAWNRMFSLIEDNDFDNESKYRQISEIIDLDNFIDFFVFNVFAGNWDMPHTNIYMFRERAETARWRWVMWDTDISYGSLGSGLRPSDKTLRWATRSNVMLNCCGQLDEEDLLWSTLILRKLLTSEVFEHRFVNRFADVMNTTLHPGHISALVDDMAAALRPNLHFETEKWSEARLTDWERGISTVKEWADDRQDHQRDHLRSKFNAGTDRRLTLDLGSGGGAVEVNSLPLKSLPWTGTYFENVPVTLRAVPQPGYRFAGWQGAALADTALVQLQLTSDQTVTVFFEPVAQACVGDGDVNSDGTLSAGDALCAFTIYLAGSTLPADCDVPGFYCEVKAADVDCDGFVTPADALDIFKRALNDLSPSPCFSALSPLATASEPRRQELVVSESRSVSSAGPGELVLEVKSVGNARLAAFGFQVRYPEDKMRFIELRPLNASSQWTALEARASGDGELLVGGFGNRVDGGAHGQLSFQLAFESNGLHAASDLTIGSLTADLAGASVLRVASIEQPRPATFRLDDNYPNPFNPGTTIAYELPKASDVTLMIYNARGQRVRLLVDSGKPAGSHRAVWDGRDDSGNRVASGVYLYKLLAGDFVASRRLLLLR